MPAHIETLAGCRIEIDEHNGLRIDGKEVHYDHDSVSSTWSAHYLPYTRYKSLIDLARAIVSDSSEFVGNQS